MTDKKISDLTAGTGDIPDTTLFEDQESLTTSYSRQASEIASYALRNMPIAIYAGATAIGIPGAPHFVSAANPIIGQKVVGAPFLIRRKTKFTGILAKSGGTVQNVPTWFFGLYTWDPATSKPTTLQASVSQASVAINTVYDLNFSASVTLEAGLYYLGMLADKTGTQSVNYYANVYVADDGLATYSSNTLQHPCCYNSSTSGLTALPNPNSGTFNAKGDLNDGALGDGYGLSYPYLLKYQIP